MKPFDIYHADFHWRTRNYPGFFLLIRQNGADWLYCGIASDDDKSEAFELNELDPDFDATGLDHTSYVYDGDPLSRIAVEKFGKRKGELQGEFLRKFREESGY
ncbi:MAG TPA: hypothetical protein VFC46_10855 [Humisphaera sp.]|nr:hypothetical protein [Humisphaera sp.]